MHHIEETSFIKKKRKVLKFPENNPLENKSFLNEVRVFNLKTAPMVVYVCVELWVYTLSLWCSNANQQTSLFTGLCVASKGSLPPYKPTSVGRTSGYSIPRPHAAYSNLPAFLVKEGGLNSGFMLAHCTAAALGECCVSHF